MKTKVHSLSRLQFNGHNTVQYVVFVYSSECPFDWRFNSFLEPISEQKIISIDIAENNVIAMSVYM